MILVPIYFGADKSPSSKISPTETDNYNPANNFIIIIIISELYYNISIYITFTYAHHEEKRNDIYLYLYCHSLR